jgi:lysozyme
MTLSKETYEFQRALVLAEEIAKPFESCSLSAYWDPAGFPTNGWGNLLSRVTKTKIMQQFGYTSKEADNWLKETYPDLTQEEADARFRINIDKAFSSVKRLVKIQLTANQYAALIDFAFNCGAGNLQISTLLRLVNRNDLISAADEFLKWNKAGGVIYRGLTRRRVAERTVFLM